MFNIVTQKATRASARTIRRGISLPIVMICCWISSQCSIRPIPRDLAVYVNRDIYGIVELETLALERYTNLTGENYISDRVLRESLNAEIIPTYTRFAVLINRIDPQTDPVQKLHAIYRDVAASRLEGFRTLLLAIDTQDPDLVRQANRKLNHGRERISHWQSRVAQLAQQYELELN